MENNLSLEKLDITSNVNSRFDRIVKATHDGSQPDVFAAVLDGGECDLNVCCLASYGWGTAAIIDVPLMFLLLLVHSDWFLIWICSWKIFTIDIAFWSLFSVIEIERFF